MRFPTGDRTLLPSLVNTKFDPLEEEVRELEPVAAGVP